MEIGSAFFSTSAIASKIEVLAPVGGVISGGAPSDSCKARDPVILARSKRVSHGRPINTLLPCGAISLSSNSVSTYVTTSSAGLFDFLAVSSSISLAPPFFTLDLEGPPLRAAGFFVKRLTTKNTAKTDSYLIKCLPINVNILHKARHLYAIIVIEARGAAPAAQSGPYGVARLQNAFIGCKKRLQSLMVYHRLDAEEQGFYL